MNTPEQYTRWAYQQSTGNYYDNGEWLGSGYSGNGEGFNNHSLEAVPNIGPIPTGTWCFGEAFDSKNTGPMSIRMTPVGHDAHGRSAFQLHGDSIRNPGTASKGCPIAPRWLREVINNSKDKLIEVIF
jgi:hypothetical protein